MHEHSSRTCNAASWSQDRHLGPALTAPTIHRVPDFRSSKSAHPIWSDSSPAGYSSEHGFGGDREKASEMGTIGGTSGAVGGDDGGPDVADPDVEEREYVPGKTEDPQERLESAADQTA